MNLVGKMSKTNKINKAISLLNKASSITKDLGNSTNAIEANNSIKKAVVSLNKINNKIFKNKVSEAELWWNTIKSGAANYSNFSQESHVKSLSILNKMINKEEDKLKDLESDSSSDLYSE